jgi:phosphohistidine phosphatase SixA
MRAPRLVASTEGPARLVVARHAQSVGNVADEEALRSWIAHCPEGMRPTLVLTSPYRRALETAR